MKERKKEKFNLIYLLLSILVQKNVTIPMNGIFSLNSSRDTEPIFKDA